VWKECGLNNWKRLSVVNRWVTGTRLQCAIRMAVSISVGINAGASAVPVQLQVSNRDQQARASAYNIRLRRHMRGGRDSVLAEK
jgi:hypothetical protein